MYSSIYGKCIFASTKKFISIRTDASFHDRETKTFPDMYIFSKKTLEV